ncbi:MAG: thioesterase family protein [Pseudomonadota bacterium]
MFETLKTFVNTWECDENDHLNVQFYFERFEDADRHLRLRTGLDDVATGRRIARHVRYHRESRVGDLHQVRSGFFEADKTALTILHVLEDVGTGSVAATALDRYVPHSVEQATASLSPSDPDPVDRSAATPRSFLDDAMFTSVTPDEILAAGGIPTFYGSVKPSECGPDGTMDDRFIIGTMSNAAAHVWEASPLTREWLDETGYGRVAVEMRLVYGRSIGLGTPTHVVSKWLDAGRTVFSFRHFLFDAATDTCVAVVDSAGLVMNLATRKSVRLPDEFQKAILDLARTPGR